MGHGGEGEKKQNFEVVDWWVCKAISSVFLYLVEI
jgi:hypothetical protein